jgi:hypothetical protein
MTKIAGSGAGAGFGSINQRHGSAFRIGTKMSRIRNTDFLKEFSHVLYYHGGTPVKHIYQLCNDKSDLSLLLLLRTFLFL